MERTKGRWSTTRSRAARPACWTVLIAAILAAPVSGQRISAGGTPMGISIRVIDQSYPIQGRNAAEVWGQIRAEGFPRFGYTYRWSYRTRQLASVAGFTTLSCGITAFDLEFDVQATYPTWDPPDDTPVELAEAWGVFAEQIEESWDEQRRFIVEFGREARRRAMRLEEGCPLLQQRANALVRELHEEFSEERREAVAAGGGVRFRWPPEGYQHLMRASSQDAPSDGRGRSPSGGAGRTEGRPAPQPATAAAVGAPDAAGVSSNALAVLKTILASELSVAGGMVGVVAGLHRAGAVEYLEVVGTSDLAGTTPLEVEGPLIVPGFSEVLIAATAARLHEQGVLDVSAPLSTWLPDLEEELGAIPLEALFTHRSGIDNARPADSVWTTILDDLNDRAVFTEPGAVFSFSQYDYPLAVRVLERATASELETLVEEAVLRPVGMSDTRFDNESDGLPVTVTSAVDLLRFGAALIDGSATVVGTGAANASWEEVALRASAPSVFAGGLHLDAPGGVRRMSIMCAANSGTDALAFQIYPDKATAFVLWSRPGSVNADWPETSARFLLEILGSELGLAGETFDPRLVRGAGQLQLPRRRCEPPGWNEVRITGGVTPAPADEWAGRYLNGDRLVILEEREGTLWLTGDMELQVSAYEGDMYFATLDGLPLYPFRLKTDAAGRRYVVLQDRAHLNEEDRVR
ncbi:MAG: serine hydrolase [Gemmatimonadota bacterium]|nr:serine hydrolase [Gemmatimonadota bacterium]